MLINLFYYIAAVKKSASNAKRSVTCFVKLNHYSNKTVKSKKSQKAIFGIQKMRFSAFS